LAFADSAKAEEAAQEAAAVARGRMEAAEARWQVRFLVNSKGL
jgi:hypothetical protein